LCSFTLVLNLRGHRRNTWAAIGCDFGGLRAYVDTAAAAVIRDTVVDGRVVYDDCAVVDVRNPRGVDVINGAVVVEVMPLPVAAMIAVAGVAVAVVDSAVEADVRTPEAAVEDVAVTKEAPVGGGPKSTVEGWGAPCTGNPVVANGRVSPVAGGPEIVGRGRFGLLIDGQRRWGRAGFFDRLLTGVYLSVVGRGVVAVVVVGVRVVVGWGLRGLRGGVSLILWRRGCVLFTALLGLLLRTDAEDSARLCGCGLRLAVIDRRHVGVGWVGA